METTRQFEASWTSRGGSDGVRSRKQKISYLSVRQTAKIYLVLCRNGKISDTYPRRPIAFNVSMRNVDDVVVRRCRPQGREDPRTIPGATGGSTTRVLAHVRCTMTSPVLRSSRGCGRRYLDWNHWQHDGVHDGSTPQTRACSFTWELHEREEKRWRGEGCMGRRGSCALSLCWPPPSPGVPSFI